MGYFSDVDADKFAKGGVIPNRGVNEDRTIPEWVNNSGCVISKRMVEASGWDDMLRRLNFTEDGS